MPQQHDFLVLTGRKAEPTTTAPDPVAIYLAGLSEQGRITMHDALNRAARVLTGEPDWRTIPWGTLTYAAFVGLRAALLSRYSPATTNLSVSAIRGVARAAWLAGTMGTEQYARLAAVRNVRQPPRLPAGRALDLGEVTALFRACTEVGTASAARDAAALALMFGAGLRRSEALDLRIENLDRETGTLRVIGKGGAEREVYLTNGGGAALDWWIGFRGTEPGPLLCAVRKDGTVFHRKMHGETISKRCRVMAERAGVQRFSPHDLRRSHVSLMLDAGADVLVVGRLVGHASPATTRIYDRRPAAAARKAAALLHVPFVRP